MDKCKFHYPCHGILLTVLPVLGSDFDKANGILLRRDITYKHQGKYEESLINSGHILQHLPNLPLPFHLHHQLAPVRPLDPQRPTLAPEQA